MNYKSLLARIIVLPCILMAGCSEEQSDSIAHNMPDPAIKKVAQHDADIIIDCSDNIHALESALLDARAKETYMRMHGLHATANLYIYTIEEKLHRKNPVLAARIGI